MYKMTKQGVNVRWYRCWRHYIPHTFLGVRTGSKSDAQGSGQQGITVQTQPGLFLGLWCFQRYLYLCDGGPFLVYLLSGTGKTLRKPGMHSSTEATWDCLAVWIGALIRANFLWWVAGRHGVGDKGGVLLAGKKSLWPPTSLLHHHHQFGEVGAEQWRNALVPWKNKPVGRMWNYGMALAARGLSNLPCAEAVRNLQSQLGHFSVANSQT